MLSYTYKREAQYQTIIASWEVEAFFTFMSVCIIYYDIRILSALKCGQNADRNYRHKSKKCRLILSSFEEIKQRNLMKRDLRVSL